MLEQLDYLIRMLTYKRSCLEIDMQEDPNNPIGDYIDSQIMGLSIAITEAYKMAEERTKDDNE